MLSFWVSGHVFRCCDHTWSIIVYLLLEASCDLNFRIVASKIWSDKMIQQKNGETAINPPPTAQLLSHQVLLQDIIDLTDIRPFPYQFQS